MYDLFYCIYRILHVLYIIYKLPINTIKHVYDVVCTILKIILMRCISYVINSMLYQVYIPIFYQASV